MKPGIFLQDFNFAGVDSDDLGKVMRDLPVIITLIDELGQYAPFIRSSETVPGCTEDTAMGATLRDLSRWLQYQVEEAYQSLRVSPPTKPGMAEGRALDLIEYAARNVADLVDIATDALTLKADPSAALSRRTRGWVARYLAEREKANV